MGNKESSPMKKQRTPGSVSKPAVKEIESNGPLSPSASLWIAHLQLLLASQGMGKILSNQDLLAPFFNGGHSEELAAVKATKLIMGLAANATEGAPLRLPAGLIPLLEATQLQMRELNPNDKFNHLICLMIAGFRMARIQPFRTEHNLKGSIVAVLEFSITHMNDELRDIIFNRLCIDMADSLQFGAEETDESKKVARLIGLFKDPTFNVSILKMPLFFKGLQDYVFEMKKDSLAEVMQWRTLFEVLQCEVNKELKSTPFNEKLIDFELRQNKYMKKRLYRIQGGLTLAHIAFNPATVPVHRIKQVYAQVHLHDELSFHKFSIVTSLSFPDTAPTTAISSRQVNSLISKLQASQFRNNYLEHECHAVYLQEDRFYFNTRDEQLCSRDTSAGNLRDLKLFFHSERAHKQRLKVLFLPCQQRRDSATNPCYLLFLQPTDTLQELLLFFHSRFAYRGFHLNEQMEAHFARNLYVSKELLQSPAEIRRATIRSQSLIKGCYSTPLRAFEDLFPFHEPEPDAIDYILSLDMKPDLFSFFPCDLRQDIPRAAIPVHLQLSDLLEPMSVGLPVDPMPDSLYIELLDVNAFIETSARLRLNTGSQLMDSEGESSTEYHTVGFVGKKSDKCKYPILVAQEEGGTGQEQVFTVDEGHKRHVCNIHRLDSSKLVGMLLEKDSK